MTDPEVEDLLRETFRAREAHAPALPPVRPKPRRTPWIAAGTATLAVLAGAIVAVGVLRGPISGTPQEPAASSGRSPTTTPGWRWESSLGAEIEVPATWTVNNSGCGFNPDPTVIRNEGQYIACLRAERPKSQTAIFFQIPDADGSSPWPWLKDTPAPVAVTIGGVPGERADWQLADGRFAGAIAVPSRCVAVIVHTNSQDVTKHMLDSFRLVDVDRLGCAG